MSVHDNSEIVCNESYRTGSEYEEWQDFIGPLASPAYDEKKKYISFFDFSMNSQQTESPLCDGIWDNFETH